MRDPDKRDPRTAVPPGSKVRHKVEPRDGPISQAARKLHLTVDEFRAMLPELYERKFPRPDPTTGMFDLKAIDAWQDSRNPQVFAWAGDQPADARKVAEDRLAHL